MGSKWVEIESIGESNTEKNNNEDDTTKDDWRSTIHPKNKIKKKKKPTSDKSSTDFHLSQWSLLLHRKQLSARRLVRIILPNYTDRSFKWIVVFELVELLWEIDRMSR